VFDIFRLARKKSQRLRIGCELSAELFESISQCGNDKPLFLHVTWNKMEENANDFVNYVVVE
jgi:hypothetical protein